ncbi:hypothetical protein BdWA1_002331 [Babesia duncani]|uniref:Uncharacterized protein n=1 Tax=Babesia duncani TaxID=323732 RepID=A0AAD9PJ21_9APIC|nr:hypothetical protein BdWA1_002331 [Babesia duncani]
MDDIWDIDVGNANLLITEANDCIKTYHTHSNSSKKVTYLTMIRAKAASLKKTIKDLEISLNDLIKNDHHVEDKRRQLTDIMQKEKNLERFLNDISHDQFDYKEISANKVRISFFHIFRVTILWVLIQLLPISNQDTVQQCLTCKMRSWPFLTRGQLRFII